MLSFRAALLMASVCLLGTACRTASEWRAPMAERGDFYDTVAPDGAWCWFQDPRAISRNGKTYVGWVTSGNGGDVQVAALDHSTETVATATLAKLHRDDHANPALHFLPDGRLVVFYSAHNGKDMFYRVSLRPDDISEWSEERTTGVNTPGDRVTYPNPVQLSGEGNRLYLFWRGGDHQPTYSHTTDLETWAPAKTLIRAGRTPYMKVCSDGMNTIHFAFSNDHPEYDSNNSIYYLAYREGKLVRADGTVVGALGEGPITPDACDLVYDSAWEGRRAWIWDVATDAQGFPVLVFSASTHPTDHDRRYGRRGETGWHNHYYYARWDGTRWQHHHVVDGGPWFPETPDGVDEQDPYYAGGIVLDHNDPSIVYLSREIDGQFEIELWRASHGGSLWAHWPVTARSATRNVRPVVPRGPRMDGAQVLWMHGDYRSYTDYATAVKRGYFLVAPRP